MDFVGLVPAADIDMNCRISAFAADKTILSSGLDKHLAATVTFDSKMTWRMNISWCGGILLSVDLSNRCFRYSVDVRTRPR